MVHGAVVLELPVRERLGGHAERADFRAIDEFVSAVGGAHADADLRKRRRHARDCNRMELVGAVAIASGRVAVAHDRNVLAGVPFGLGAAPVLDDGAIVPAASAKILDALDERILAVGAAHVHAKLAVVVVPEEHPGAIRITADLRRGDHHLQRELPRDQRVPRTGG